MNIAKPISAVTEENLKTRFGSLAAPTFKELIDKALKVEKNINWTMFGHALLEEAGLYKKENQIKFIGKLVTRQETAAKEAAKTADKDIKSKEDKVKAMFKDRNYPSICVGLYRFYMGSLCKNG